MRNIKCLKYVFREIFYAHALVKLNCTSNFNLSRSKKMLIAFTIFRRCLRVLVYGGFIHYLMGGKKNTKFVSGRQLRKNFVYAVFFLARVGKYGIDNEKVKQPLCDYNITTSLVIITICHPLFQKLFTCTTTNQQLSTINDNNLILQINRKSSI